MPTGDTRVELVLKRFLSENRLDANFLAYLRSEYLDLGSRIFPISGLFTYPVTITPDWMANDFDLTPDPIEGIDDAGHVIWLTARGTNISFENNLFDVYYLGLKYIEVPDGIYTNPRTGIPEYDKTRNEVGEKDEPDTVTDNGDGTITFRVNSIFETGVTHALRQVMVWLKNPLVVDEAVAIETRPVAYAAPNNSITTVAALGQTAVSTDPNDYYVACLGVTVRNAGGPAPVPSPYGDEYIQLGYIIGGGGGGVPGSISTAEQIDLSGGGGHSLQKAYDGLAGNGSGRIIVVEDEAVLLRQESSDYRSEDIANASIRIRKDIPTSNYGVGFESEGGLDIASRFRSNYGIMIRSALNDMSGSDELRIEEDVDILDANTVSFTRGAVNLTLPGSTHSDIRVGDLVEIIGSALGNDGVFSIAVINATTLDCVEMSRHEPPATSPGWVAEAGLKARIFRPRVMIHPKFYSLVIKGINDFYREVDPGGMLNAGQIDIDITPNASNDDMFIRCVSGARYFKVTALGKIYGSHDLDIDGDVHCDQVLLDAGAGTTGVDLNGKNIDMKGGYIKDTTGTAVLVDDDVLSSGSLRAYTDVYADNDANGAGDFKYGLAKSYTKWITPDEGFYRTDHLYATTADYQYNAGLRGVDPSNYPKLIASSGLGGGAPHSPVTFPVRLPDGAIITKIRMKVYQANALGVMMELHSWTPEWTEAVAPNDRVQIGATYSNANAGYRTIDTGVIAVTIDDAKMYQIFAHTDNDDAHIYWIAITYTLATITQTSQ